MSGKPIRDDGPVDSLILWEGRHDRGMYRIVETDDDVAIEWQRKDATGAPTWQPCPKFHHPWVLLEAVRQLGRAAK